jgi:fatty-acyl-CoA synthase
VLFQHPAVGLAAVIGQPDAYAGELPVAYVQLKPGASVAVGELEEWARARTPERAANPVAIYQVNPMPLTGVGKVFKPQLRWDATQRVFTQALAPLHAQGIRFDITVGAHGTHGSVATVTCHGVPEASRAAVVEQVQRQLSPFVIRHEIVWG